MRVGYLWIDQSPDSPLEEILAPLTPALSFDTHQPRQSKPGHSAFARTHENPVGLWFDASGIRFQYGSEEYYGQAVLSAVQRGGGSGRIGIASSPWVAQIAALLAAEGEVLSVPEKETRAFLRSLPLTWLPLPARLQARLHTLGITTIGQFADLPRASIRQRFGTLAAQAHQLACGEDTTSLEWHTPLPPLQLERILEPPLLTITALTGVLANLCQSAARLLNQQRLAALALQLILTDERGNRTVLARRLPHPTQTANALYRAIQAMITRIALDHALSQVQLNLEQLVPQFAIQVTLFAESSRPEEQEQLWQLVQRFAPGRVFRVLEHRPHAPLPELRWLLQGGSSRSGVPSGQKTPVYVTLRQREEDAPRARQSNTSPLSSYPLYHGPVQLVQRGHQWWLKLDGRWQRIRRGGPSHEIDLWWPSPVHRRITWMELADGQRWLFCWDAVEQRWYALHRLD